MDLLAEGGGKRGVEEDGVEVRGVKRVRRVRGGGIGVDVKRVAEMVLVLEAIGKIRGGKSPSEVERELMAEAREKLVDVCQDFAPKDVFPGDVFGGVIEDLGLSKSKEQQRLGYRVPMMSIAEKLLLSKRKFQMEKTEDFAISPPSAPQRLHGAPATTFENRSPSLPLRVTTHDKASQAHIPPASRQPAANFTPAPFLYQPHTSQVRGSVSNVVPSIHPFKGPSLPLARVDGPPFRVDGRPNGVAHSHASQAQAQAHPAWNQTMVRPPGFPVQPQSFSSTQRGSDNRLSTQPATSKPLTTQVITGNLSTLQQDVHSKDFVKAPSTRNPHAEIVNIVQKVSQKRLERPLWTPPSRDYMNKALTCQMCQSTVSDVDSVLICDNCEKGHHIKCLPTANHKGAPKGEWHCLRCLGANHGKPLPPKYGKVMRNQKSVGPSAEKKSEMIDFKPNIQKGTANGKILIQKGPLGIARSLSSQQSPESKFQSALPMHSNEAYSSEGETEDITSGTRPDKISSAAHLITSEQPADEKKLVTSVLRPFPNSNIALCMENHPQPLGDQSKEHLRPQRNGEFPSSEEHCGRVSSQSDPQKEVKGDELGVVRVNDAEVATGTSMSAEPLNSSSGHSYDFDWVGNISEVVDGNCFYQSCRINGVVYKVHDHVHIFFDNGKLTPSKLQAMWEDRITRSKRVTVNRFYFPSDLPEAVGRPCGLESSEVYESSRSISLDAGLIQGPCDVLPPNKFEAEKRASAGMEGDHSSRPCYVCKWIYDESKGSFRDVSC